MSIKNLFLLISVELMLLKFKIKECLILLKIIEREKENKNEILLREYYELNYELNKEELDFMNNIMYYYNKYISKKYREYLIDTDLCDVEEQLLKKSLN